MELGPVADAELEKAAALRVRMFPEGSKDQGIVPGPTTGLMT